MTSDEDESYSFDSAVKPEGKVEEWMNKIEDEMKESLHTLTKKNTYFYAKENRIDWIKGSAEMPQIGMVALVGT